VQTPIANYLMGRGWRVLRMNCGVVRVGHGRFSRIIRLHEPGTADLLAFEPSGVGVTLRPDESLSIENMERLVVGIPVWIECKTTRGRQTPEQKLFERQMVNIHGHRYILARSLDDVRKELKI
jgi:hypothetical protein